MIEKMAKECGDEDVLRGREPLQMGWYRFVTTLVRKKTVLDVGCGSGEGLRRLCSEASNAVGIDLDPRLVQPDLEIYSKDITQIPSKSFDVVACVDVIEHVQEDRLFLDQLVRVAREIVFVSTPNYTVSKNSHPYHVREYTPREFEQLFIGLGGLRIFGGDSTGEKRQEVLGRSMYYWLNDLYLSPGTILLAKVLKRLLFTKVWAHQAAVVALGPHQ